MSSQTVPGAGRSPRNDSRPSPLLGRPAYLLAAAALAVVVFLFDTYSPLEIASAVLYVLVVFIVARTGNRTDILAAAAGSLVLTLVSYFMRTGSAARRRRCYEPSSASRRSPSRRSLRCGPRP
jgi:hypothetical protein